MRIFAAVLLMGSLLSACSLQRESAPTPNVLFILADDMGPAQLGCYGSTYYETPHIDALARGGMRFTQAYSAAAICSPTRAALMTAKSPASLHLTDFIPGAELADKPLMNPDWQRYLPLEEKTMGEYFQEMGYETALFGKWHLSTDKQPPKSEAFNPNKQGFGHQMVTYKPVAGKTDPEHDPHNVDSITQRGIRFLEERTKDQPFLMILSHNSIHDPLMESEASIEEYRQKQQPEDSTGNAVWGAMVERLDGSVGRVLAALERLGLRENTLVVFYSDNGAKHAYASQMPLRAGKGWLYEGGIRVPLIVNWPEKVQPATESDALITSMDLLPTLLSAVGKDTPELEEGRSFWAVANGTQAVASRPLFWHYPHYHLGSGMRPAAAMRSGRWKLIEWYEASLSGQPDAFELYDLSQDPGEQINLADTYPDTLTRLRADLTAWRNTVGAQLPLQRSGSDGQDL